MLHFFNQAIYNFPSNFHVTFVSSRSSVKCFFPQYLRLLVLLLFFGRVDEIMRTMMSADHVVLCGGVNVA